MSSINVDGGGMKSTPDGSATVKKPPRKKRKKTFQMYQTMFFVKMRRFFELGGSTLPCVRVAVKVLMVVFMKVFLREGRCSEVGVVEPCKDTSR